MEINTTNRCAVASNPNQKRNEKIKLQRIFIFDTVCLRIFPLWIFKRLSKHAIFICTGTNKNKPSNKSRLWESNAQERTCLSSIAR